MNWHFDNKIPVDTPILVRIRNETLYGKISIYDIVQTIKNDEYYIQKYYVVSLHNDRCTWPISWIAGWITCEELEQDWNNTISS